MKSILLSVRPEWVAKILNGKKTLEIRKTAPKCDLPIEVYIYCTKTIKPLSDYGWGEFTFDDLPKLGKVVAKFTLKKIERIYIRDSDKGIFDEPDYEIETNGLSPQELCKGSCLTQEEIYDYMVNGSGYAWHISDLQIFDEPKELSDFMVLDETIYNYPTGTIERTYKPIKRPFQSWGYVEAMK